MKLACNGSEELLELLREGVAVDYIKTGVYGKFDEMFPIFRQMRPVLLHGLGFFEDTGIPDIGIIDKEFANDMIGRCGSPHYGLHMGIQKKHMLPGMSDEDIHRRMAANTLKFKAGLAVPLLLEPPPDSPTDRTVYDHYPYCDAEKVTRLVRETETFLLLDIAHARVTAGFRGWELREYISALPLDLVKEIHVTGSGIDEQGYPMDTHGPMSDEDYELLLWVLEKTSPDVITLEYGGFKPVDKSLLRRQLETLSDIIAKYNK